MSTAAATRLAGSAVPKAAAKPAGFWTPVARVLQSGLTVGGVVAVALTVWILAVLGGFDYYTTPISVRAYAPMHRVLRPSGPYGQTFGVIGAALMLVPFIYAARKRFPWLKNVGGLRGWLEVHLFCGIVGPVLVTFHTSFKFNGIVSAAYWSMVLVMVSGFVGRFLYVRIPRTLRGVELTRTELDARADELSKDLERTVKSESLRRRFEIFEHGVRPEHLSLLNLMCGEFAVGRKVRALERDMIAADLPEDLRAHALAVEVERALLLRRAAYLQRTKKLFELWHVFHLPFVLLMLIIVTVHIAVVLYLGYVPFRW